MYLHYIKCLLFLFRSLKMLSYLLIMLLNIDYTFSNKINNKKKKLSDMQNLHYHILCETQMP